MTSRRHLTAIALTLVLAGCGAAKPAPSATTSNTTTPATTATTTATTPTQPPASTSASMPPAGGPVPAGFDPLAFTAISPHAFWLLGTAPCSHPVCTSIVRTSDGGAHFVGIPAPPMRLHDPGALLFADSLNGFAGGTGYPEPRPLYETHDGAAHWTLARSDVIAFTVTAGHIYAITGQCTNGVCAQLRLARSPAGADDWTSVALPVDTASGLPSLTAAGTSAWISLTPATGTPSKQDLFVSRDGGRTLAQATGVCYSGLSGRLEASSAAVVWAVCPTGMEAGGWRSADAGAHWSAVPGNRLPGLTGGLANSLRLAPASDTAVLVLPGGSEPAFLSTDSGQTFRRTDLPTNNAGIGFVGFTDPQTASLLAVDNTGRLVGPDRALMQTLWRSTDGGVHWRSVRIAP